MAQRFRLILDFDDASIAALKSEGMRLAIAKPAGVLPPNVVWLACDPAPRTTIVWGETYGVFGADVPPRESSPISIRCARYPAAQRALHPFRGDRFGPPVALEAIPAGHYDVANQASLTAVFGLLQSAVVNGTRVRSPVNVATLTPGSRADFVAVTRLYLWVGPVAETGSTLAQLPAGAAPIDFSFEDSAKRFRFAAADASFRDDSADQAQERMNENE